jgi:hypothetical protein
MKILSVGNELLHADERTDGHDEANSRFPKFYENLKQAQRFASSAGCRAKPHFKYINRSSERPTKLKYLVRIIRNEKYSHENFSKLNS